MVELRQDGAPERKALTPPRHRPAPRQRWRATYLRAAFPATLHPTISPASTTPHNLCHPGSLCSKRQMRRKAAVQPTKYTEYTKHERVMRRILLTHPEGILAAPNLCPFVYFVSFVVPIALSRVIARRGACPSSYTFCGPI